MSNSDHNSNKHAAVLEEEIPVSVKSQASSQDPAKVTARLDRLRNGLREHPFKAAIVIVTLLVILIVIAVGFFYVSPANWSPFMPNGIAGVLKGVAAVFWAFGVAGGICAATELDQQKITNATSIAIQMQSADLRRLARTRTALLRETRIQCGGVYRMT